MARRKGGKFWDGLSRREWLMLFGDPEIMSDLMMDIFRVLCRGRGEDRAKNIASALKVDYRGLNSAVGQAGIKIRAWYEARHGIPPASKESDEPADAQDAEAEALRKPLPAESVLNFEGTLFAKREEEIAASGMPLSPEEKNTEEKTVTEVPVSSDTARRKEVAPALPQAPWEYVFDGAEEPDGTYLWIVKPSALSAWNEAAAAKNSELMALRRMLADDSLVYGEGSLFGESSSHTLEEVRSLLHQYESFVNRSRRSDACCAVCGLSRISLLHPEPYGKKGNQQKGLYFCPTHGALFRAHLISFSDNGTLLVSKSLSKEEEEKLGIAKGMPAKAPFSKRRMAEHRREFRENHSMEKEDIR